MHTISPAVDSLVRQILATGKYSDPDAVLLDALHEFISRKDAIEAIQQGIDDVAAGRVRPWRDAVADLRARHNLPRS